MSSIQILGGGLAGLAAATALAEQGFSVEIFESRDRLGGRAGSFVDPTSHALTDACQHVSMGCCTNFAHFCRTLGIEKFLASQPTLYFMTPDRKVSRFGADPLPAPIHLARALWGAHYLSLGDKARIAWGMLRLQRTDPEFDCPLLDWLKRNRQNARTISRFWNVVLISALNDSVENLGLKYARKVFVDGFLTHRKGFEVQLPIVPLGRFYGEEMRQWFAQKGVQIHLNAAIRYVQIEQDRVVRLHMRDGSERKCEEVIAALPFERLLDVLPENVVDQHSIFRRLQELRVSPITSVHLWFDQLVTDYPHIVLVGCLGQWIFNRGQTPTGEYYLQVVISASDQIEPNGRDWILQEIVAEIRELFPAARNARLLRSRVITEHKATFRAVPGVDTLRPGNQTPIANLFLAGDWTLTGWPATMEGAVRSGYLGAEAVLQTHGKLIRLLQPDLR